MSLGEKRKHLKNFPYSFFYAVCLCMCECVFLSLSLSLSLAISLTCLCVCLYVCMCLYVCASSPPHPPSLSHVSVRVSVCLSVCLCSTTTPPRISEERQRKSSPSTSRTDLLQSTQNDAAKVTRSLSLERLARERDVISRTTRQFSPETLFLRKLGMSTPSGQLKPATPKQGRGGTKSVYSSTSN